MSTSFDVACLGELVIDFVPAIEPDGRHTYEAKAGGAPGNVAVAMARLGRKVAMLAKVGDEAFGSMLVAMLARHGVDTTGIVRAAANRTGLAFVVLGPGGERDFFFYRDNAADMFLAPEEIGRDLVAGAGVLHVNTVVLLGETSARAQAAAIDTARASQRLVSVDVNFRRSLWPDAQRMVQAGRDMIRHAGVLKLTEEELHDVADGATIADGVRSLWHPDLRFCAVTRGVAGAELFTADHHVTAPAFPVDAIDTTGAGDAFMACLLSDLIGAEFDVSSRSGLADILRRACAAGAISTTRKGAMESMPDQAEIAGLLRRG